MAPIPGEVQTGEKSESRGASFAWEKGFTSSDTGEKKNG